MFSKWRNLQYKVCISKEAGSGEPNPGLRPKKKKWSVSWAVEMEASKQEFFNWVLIQLVKLSGTFQVFRAEALDWAPAIQLP